MHRRLLLVRPIRPLGRCLLKMSLARLRLQAMIAPMPTIVGMILASNGQWTDIASITTNRHSNAAGNRLSADNCGAPKFVSIALMP